MYHIINIPPSALKLLTETGVFWGFGFGYTLLLIIKPDIFPC